MDSADALKALEKAAKDLPANQQPIHHSDSGCQYCSHEYVGSLRQRGLEVSMTEDNHCYENAHAALVRLATLFFVVIGCLGQETGEAAMRGRAFRKMTSRGWKIAPTEPGKQPRQGIRLASSSQGSDRCSSDLCPSGQRNVRIRSSNRFYATRKMPIISL